MGSVRSVLITGGCGFIGVNLVGFLLYKGAFNIRVLDNLSVGTRENLATVTAKHGSAVEEVSPEDSVPAAFSGTVQLITGDIRERESCQRATEGMDVVIHLAAHAGVIPSIEDPFFDFEVNVLGTLNLLNASVEQKVDRFILASSNAPVGDQPPPMNEGLAPRPLSPYGASKLAGEGYCSAFYGSYGLKTTVLRFSNAYGPYSLHKNSVISKFVKDALIEERLIIYGDGKQTRDFIHVDDLCHAINLSINSSVCGETFHLGTGRETRIADLAELVRKQFDEKVEIVFEPARAGEIIRNFSDVTKVREALGFSAKVGIEDGVRQVGEWFIEQGIKKVQSTQTLSGSE